MAPAMEVSTLSIGLTMNCVVGIRSKSARIDVTSWSIEVLPESTARAMVFSTEEKLRLTAVSMDDVALCTGPPTKAASASPAAVRDWASGVSVMSGIRMLRQQMFELGAGEWDSARRRRGQRTPFGKRERPEDVRRQVQVAEAVAQPAL